MHHRAVHASLNIVSEPWIGSFSRLEHIDILVQMSSNTEGNHF